MSINSLINHYFTPEQQQTCSIFIKDKIGQYQYLNDRTQRFLNVVIGENDIDCIGLRDDEIFNAAEAEKIMHYDEKARRSDKIIEQDIDLTVDDGRISKPFIYKQRLNDRFQYSVLCCAIHRNFFHIDNQPIILSEREMFVFANWVYGISANDAAKSVGLSASTISTYIDRIKTKLNKRSRMEVLCNMSQSLSEELFKILNSSNC